MIRFLTIFILLLAQSAFAQDKTYIKFEKKESGRTFRLELPLKCRVYENGKERRFGKITSYTSEDIFFEHKEYDSSEVNAIMDSDTLTKREKFDLIDTLITNSVVTYQIPIDSLEMISVLSGSDNTKREVAVLGAAGIFLASTAGFLISITNNVGAKWGAWHYISLSGMGVGGALMAALIKRNIKMEKWKIVPDN